MVGMSAGYWILQCFSRRFASTSIVLSHPMVLQASHGSSRQESDESMELMRKQLLEQQTQVQR